MRILIIDVGGTPVKVLALRILATIKKGRHVTTVFVQQGYDALDPKILASNPSADVTI